MRERVRFFRARSPGVVGREKLARRTGLNVNIRHTLFPSFTFKAVHERSSIRTATDFVANKLIHN
jgi:hypothetical protein